MGLFEIILIALGLSMDAFAVSVCLGLGTRTVTIKKSLIVGLYFGFFQAAMPLIGFFSAMLFRDAITNYDHWIAFSLLVFLGGKMMLNSFKRDVPGCTDRACPASGHACEDRECPEKVKETSFAPKTMLPYALATSIDALAAGVSFAFIQVEIFSTITIIGITTLILSMIGVKIGNLFGTKIKSHAELLGGIILILMGVKILLNHLF